MGVSPPFPSPPGSIRASKGFVQCRVVWREMAHWRVQLGMQSRVPGLMRLKIMFFSASKRLKLPAKCKQRAHSSQSRAKNQEWQSYAEELKRNLGLEKRRYACPSRGTLSDSEVTRTHISPSIFRVHRKNDRGMGRLRRHARSRARLSAFESSRQSISAVRGKKGFGAKVARNKRLYAVAAQGRKRPRFTAEISSSPSCLLILEMQV